MNRNSKKNLRRFGLPAALCLASVSVFCLFLRNGEDETVDKQKEGAESILVLDNSTIIQKHPSLSTIESLRAPSNAPVRLAFLNQLSFHDKLKAIHALPDSLTTNEQQYICGYIMQPISYNDHLKVGGECVLRNDLMNVLRKQGNAIPELIDVFSDMYFNTNMHSVMRGYALQHLSAWGLNQNAEQKTNVCAILRGAAFDADECVAGTAVIGYGYYIARKDQIDERMLLCISNALVNGGANDELVVAATGFCEKFEMYEFKNAIRGIFSNEHMGFINRLAAMHTLFQFEDIEFLASIDMSKDPRMEKAFNQLLQDKMDSHHLGKESI